MENNSFNYTVVIPFGKKDGNFLRCIGSIITQNILPKQVLVICNGDISQEYVESIMDGFKETTSYLVKFIYPKMCANGNVARNIGLSLVCTEWVTFVDSDDWWDSGWINSILLISKVIKFDFLYGSMKIYVNQNDFKESRCIHFSDFKTPENYLLAYKAAQTSSYVIKTSLARKTRWDESLNRHQDYDFFVRLVRSPNVKSYAATDLYVNVDWTVPRRTKYNLDYLRVVKNWKTNVERIYYVRHIKNIMFSAIKSRDWYSLIPILKELVFSLIICKNFLKNSLN